MKFDKIDNMVNGWFVGDFEPSIIKTNNVEVALKSYNQGDKEERHYHKIATEITVISQGRVLMNNMGGSDDMLADIIGNIFEIHCFHLF